MFRHITIALFAASIAISAAAAKPRRIVSLYLCADELVLQLAEQRNIASVTFLSRDPMNSNVAQLAARVPVNRGLAEEVLAQRPDVAITSDYDARPAAAMLKRAGVPTISLGSPPRNLDEVRRDIRTVAEAVGERENGERMIGQITAQIAALPAPARGRKPSAVVLNPNGFTIGAGSLVDEIFARAGVENLAAREGIDNYGRLPLETILRSGADIAILNADRDGPPSLATEFLRHPALASLKTRLVVLPARLWTCGGPAVVEAIGRLSAIASESRAGTAP